MRAGRCHPTVRAFTLLEVTLVVAIMAIVAAMVLPNFFAEVEREELPGSAHRLRSMLTMVQANAAFDGKRYRVRFPMEDELDALGTDRGPIIEREDDPFDEPEEWAMVTAPWAIVETLRGKVWCAEVRLGRPTVEKLQELRSRIEEALEEEFEEFDTERPPLIFYPDGEAEWATFVLTQAPRDTEPDDLEEHPTVELIFEGPTGLAWLQRPLYEEELDLFEEKNWPVVLRKDFTDPRVLTEDDVLELRDIPVSE